MAKTYRIAVAGSTGRGNYGHALDVAWKDIPNAQIVAVSDPDKVGRAAAARRLQVKQAFADYRQMLDETKPDLLAICPRWLDQHHDMAIAAAERGVHVYMEKPFCRSPSEADAIIAACEKTHVKLSIAHPTRFSPKLAAIRQLIDSGRIGRVLEFRGRGKEDRRGGGEDLWVLGTHVMDMILALGGMPEWCFALVTQDRRPITAADVKPGNEGIGPLAGDHVEAMYSMPNACTAYFSSHRGAAGRPSRYGLTVLGSAGVIELLEGPMPSVKFLGDPSWSPGRSGNQWQDVSSAGIGKPEPLDAAEYRARHTMAIRDLFAAIEEDRQPSGSAYEGRKVVEMIAGVFESQRLGRPVPLPLANRRNPLEVMQSG